jgi:hypothetical protein
MRGQRFKNILAENIHATAPYIDSQKRFSGRKKMCWRCQKDKSPVGGHIKTFTGGTMKFICLDCINAKKGMA